jgi:hypothetical protein
MSCKSKRDGRKAKKEFNQQMEWAQVQRKNYKHGFLSVDQIKALESMESWTWTTPDYVKFNAYRVYSDGQTEPVTIIKHQPYGIPGNYELSLSIETNKKSSIMMIVKNNKIVKHYDCVDKCSTKGCVCTSLTSKIIV